MYKAEEVEITITTSDGSDGAIVIFIDTPCAEPDASDSSRGLRVHINDDCVYEGKAHVSE